MSNDMGKVRSIDVNDMSSRLRGNLEETLERLWNRAYQFGYTEGYNSRGIENEFDEDMQNMYQKGLDDAWKCAKRILQIGDNSIHSWDLEKIFKGLNSQVTAFEGTASEAIEKIATYEKEQKEKNGKKCEECMYYDYALGCVLETDCADYSEFVSKENTIKVGDEVVSVVGFTAIVTHVHDEKRIALVYDDGSCNNDVLKERVEKTGRHFDIQSILDRMNEGE